MNSTSYCVSRSDLPRQLPRSLEDLITSIRQHLEQTSGAIRQISPETVRRCVIEANIKAEDLQPWADFDHPIEHSYGRKPVYDDGYFEIMVMSWAVGDYSAIHDHGCAQWGAVQCFGQAEHRVYQLKDNVLHTLAEMCLTPGSVNAVHHDLIHQMGNLSAAPFLSLHVYGCQDRCSSVTGNARIFDLFEGSVQYTSGGVFFCLPEEKINQRDCGLLGDIKTTLHHNQRMLARVSQILETSGDVANLQETASLLEQRIALLKKET
ncbi:MAG: cysteine dioxygenase [Cyanothece sp. SIO1E1]|nr:cysteine dioxygenase [Cyanothece sp. SIO1E1]